MNSHVIHDVYTPISTTSLPLSSTNWPPPSMAPQMGGTKQDQGKPRFDLLSYPFLLGISKVMTFGAEKYEAHNWRKGLDYSRCFGALMRHLWAWWWGEENDKETGMSHLWHAGCCLMFLTELSETRRDLDDRFKA